MTYSKMLENWPELTFKKLKHFLIDIGLYIDNMEHIKLLVENWLLRIILE
jgi:hypothetical protein